MVGEPEISIDIGIRGYGLAGGAGSVLQLRPVRARHRLPGQIYRDLPGRIGGGVEMMHLLDRMKGERDLSWIAECARTEVLLHPEWSVTNVLPPATRDGGAPGGGGLVREKTTGRPHWYVHVHPGCRGSRISLL